MYQEAGRRQLYGMQTVTRPSSTSGLSSQSRIIAVIAILLFAFSGLLSGFAVGTFIRSTPARTSTPNPVATTVVHKSSPSPTPTPAQDPVKLGWPVVDQYESPEAADGNTRYMLSAYATDQSKGNTFGNPIHTPAITCILWLTKEQKSPEKNLKPISAVYNPMDGELIEKLHFDSTTPRVQTCDANGRATWEYTVDRSVRPGDYYLAVVTDWSGVHYNWSWIAVTITKENR